jgi:phosphatidylglycerophosphatase C
VVDGAIGKPRNTQCRAEVSVSVRERAFVLAGSAEPSIPLAQGTDRTPEDDGMNTGALVVFDLDGTISRHDTLLAYLTGFLSRYRARWPRALLSAPALLGFVTGFVDRGQLKAALMKAVLGGCTRTVIDAWTATFVTELLARGVFADALAAIATHRESADTLVLMSASPDLYVPEIGARLGFTETICTGVRWRGERLDGALATANRQGAEKARCFSALRGRYPQAATVAYGNSASDFDHLKLADEAWLINASPALRRAAERAHFRCLCWR